MAVTTLKSTQLTTIDAGKKLDAADYAGSLMPLNFDFTQTPVGDAASTVELVRIPPGKYILLGWLSFIAADAFGAARVLDIGWNAYIDGADGTTVVAASAAGINNDIDVSGATNTVGLGLALAAGLGRRKLFNSRNGVTIIATVAGGTIPDLTKINGTIMVSRD
jgi:hypothetical protein